MEEVAIVEVHRGEKEEGRRVVGKGFREEKEVLWGKERVRGIRRDRVVRVKKKRWEGLGQRRGRRWIIFKGWTRLESNC